MPGASDQPLPPAAGDANLARRFGLSDIRAANPTEDSIMLLFSGGLDSTLEAVGRLRDYHQVHLLTFDNGMCSRVWTAARRANELQQVFGATRFSHAVVHTGPLIKQLLNNWRQQWHEYRSPLMVDMACKMSAVAELIVAAKARGVRDVSDGSAKAQTEIFVQNPVFSDHFRPWIEGFGLRLVRPALFDLPRPERIQMLHDLGLDAGWEALEKIPISSQKVHQPFCWYAFVTFFFTGPLRHWKVIDRHALPLDRAMRMWDELLPVAHEYVQQRLTEQEPSDPAESR